jgi:hypothetical protein
MEVVRNRQERFALLSGGTKNGIVVLGKDAMQSFNDAHGAAPTNTKPIVNALRKNFLVVLTDEHNSSLRCPLSFDWNKFVRAASYREKECKGCRECNPVSGNHTHGDADFTFRFDRDIAAAVNFLTILCFMMMHNGLRPAAFAPANAKDVYKNR